MHLSKIAKPAFILSFVFVSGCVDIASVARVESEALKAYDGTSTLSGVLNYGTSLSDSYLGLTRRGSYIDDGFFTVLLGLAASTAFQTVKGADATELTKLGITAFTVNEGSKYIANSEALGHLLTAAEQTNCVVRHGQVMFPVVSENPNTEAEIVGIVENGIQTTRITLRQRLLKKVPDYEGLATTLASAIVAEEKATEESIVANNEARDASRTSYTLMARKAQTEAEKKAIAELRTKTATCVIKAAKVE